MEIAAQLGEFEADRTWQRFGISLPIHTGLIAIVSYALKNDLYALSALIAGLGEVLAFAWYRIVTFSQFAEKRWRDDMRAIVDATPGVGELLRSRSQHGPRDKRPRTSATDNAKLMVRGVALFWGLILCNSAVQIV